MTKKNSFLAQLSKLMKTQLIILRRLITNLFPRQHSYD